MVCAPLPTVKLWNDCVAAFQLAFPAWFTKTLQVPTAANVTVVPESVQTEALAESTE